MKKRFVAKQVGVLSLTAVLAGMPAVNVLAEDVYQEKVGEVQTEAEKALLRAALNVSFVTEYGENVGNTYVDLICYGHGIAIHLSWGQTTICQRDGNLLELRKINR